MDDRSNYWTRRATSRLSRRGVLIGGGGLTAGLGGLLLAGCGDDDDKGAPASSTAAASGTSGSASGTAVAASPAVKQPRRGGTFKYPVTSDAPHMDIHRASTAHVIAHGVGAAYSNIVKPKQLGHNHALIVEGDLAKSFEMVDPTTYIFHLRENAKFHDIAPVNGRLATAEDAVFSFKRQIAEKVNAGYLGNATNFEAVDAKTLKITLSGPNVDFLAGFTDPTCKVVAPEAVAVNGNLEKGPTIGTGPFIFKEWERGVARRLTRNPSYFLDGLPYVDALDFLIIPDAATVEVQLRGGGLQIVPPTSALSKDQIAKLQKDGFSSYELAPSTAANGVHMNINNHKTVKGLQDPRIRQALTMAIDRKLLIANVGEGKGKLAATGARLPGPDWGLPEAELDALLGYKPADAKKLLAEASASTALGSSPIEFQVTNVSSYIPSGELIQASWRDAGLRANIKLIEPAELTGSVFNPAVATYLMCLGPQIQAVTSTMLDSWYKTNGSRNSGKISDPQLDALIDKQRAAFDEKERRTLLLEIQRIIAKQGYFLTTFGAAGGTLVFPKTVHDIEQENSTYHWAYTHVWLDA